MGDVQNLYTVTYTGEKFFFFRPEEHRYRIRDIAHHLSLICRYGGACKYHYSVAQHSCLMAEVSYKATGSPELALDCLLHDASEAYIGDMKKPIKVQLPAFEEIESRIDKAIRTRLNRFSIFVPMKQTALCKELDKRMFLTEWPQLMGQEDCGGWYPDLEPFPNVSIDPWDPEEAEHIFMKMLEHFAADAANLYGRTPDNGPEL